MGFKISWVGFQGVSKDQILETAGLRDTGEEDEANEAPLSGATLPNGCFILFSNDFEFISAKRLSSFSANCRVVACQVHEGVMVSGAFSYEQGIELWQIRHDSQIGPDHLFVAGSPPLEFDPIRRRLMQQQNEETGEEEFPVDHIFDIPVEVAAELCGYRHDIWQFDWGQPKFTRLEVVKRQPSWSLGRLLGRR